MYVKSPRLSSKRMSNQKWKERKEQNNGGNSRGVATVRWVTLNSLFLRFQSHHLPTQLPPGVRSGPEGPKQVRQVQADSQKTSLRPRPNFRTTANNTCPDDVMLSRVSHTPLKSNSLLNLPLLHLLPPSLKPYTSCSHYSPLVSISSLKYTFKLI